MDIMGGPSLTSSVAVASKPEVGVQNASPEFELIASPKANNEVDSTEVGTASTAVKKRFFPATLFAYPPIKDRTCHR